MDANDDFLARGLGVQAGRLSGLLTRAGPWEAMEPGLCSAAGPQLRRKNRGVGRLRCTKQPQLHAWRSFRAGFSNLLLAFHNCL